MYLSPYVLEMTAYLQSVLDALEAGTAETLYADPFTESSIPDARVDELIAAIDQEFAHEIGNYRDYHRNRSGADTTPDFHRLTPSARRAVAEECLRIIRRHDHPQVAGGGC